MIRRPPRSTLFPHTPLFRSLADPLPIFDARQRRGVAENDRQHVVEVVRDAAGERADPLHFLRLRERSEEHTSELQSPCNLVCRLLLEKNKNYHILLTAIECH